MKRNNPLVSVIMPVHNGARYLRDAIESILLQDEVALEFIIIDDCSKDDTDTIINSYHDARIVFLRNAQQEGVASCLNKGIDSAHGTYIARMDADDVSLPMRLKKQVDILHADAQIGICGTSVEYIGSWNGKERVFWGSPEELHALLIFANPFAHPTVMMKRAILEKYQLRYSTDFTVAQDYDLWERASREVKLFKLPDVLLQYRMHAKNVTTTRKASALPLLYQVYSRILDRIGIKATADDLILHHQIATRQRLDSLSTLRKAENWLLNIQRTALPTQIYSNESLQQVLGFFWFEVMRNCGNLGIASFLQYRASHLRPWYSPSLKDMAVFFLSCLRYQLLSPKNSKGIF